MTVSSCLPVRASRSRNSIRWTGTDRGRNRPCGCRLRLGKWRTPQHPQARSLRRASPALFFRTRAVFRSTRRQVSRRESDIHCCWCSTPARTPITSRCQRFSIRSSPRSGLCRSSRFSSGQSRRRAAVLTTIRGLPGDGAGPMDARDIRRWCEFERDDRRRLQPRRPGRHVRLVPTS